jgi:hypothetical protein
MQDKNNNPVQSSIQTEKDNKTTAGIFFLLACSAAVADEAYELGLDYLFYLALLYLIYQNYCQGRSVSELNADYAFLYSAKTNKLFEVKKFIDHYGLERMISRGTETGKNALHYAIEGDAESVIHYLLSCDFKASQRPNLRNKLSILNQGDFEGSTPIHLAVENVIKEYAIKKKPDSYKILFTLLKPVNTGLVQGFLGANLPLLKNERINLSIKNKQQESVTDLLGKLFRTAAKHDDVENMSRLLNYLTLANLNSYGPSSHRNALHVAVCMKSSRTVEFLIQQNRLAIQQGVSEQSMLMHQDNRGNTPIHEALIDLKNGTTKSFHILNALLAEPIVDQKRLIEPTLKTKQGVTILCLADKLPPSEDKQKVIDIILKILLLNADEEMNFTASLNK